MTRKTKETAFSLFSGDGPVYILGTTMVVEDQLGAFDESLDEEIDSDEYVPSIQSLIQCIVVHPSTLPIYSWKKKEKKRSILRCNRAARASEEAVRRRGREMRMGI